MGLRRSALYALGIVILCIVSLYLLLRIRRSVEGFEEVTDCISVPGVQYVRLQPSLKLPVAQAFMTVTQVRVLDENGNNLALNKNISDKGGTYGTTSSQRLDLKAVTDGTDKPRLMGPTTSWSSSTADGTSEFLEIDLGSPQTVSAVTYFGAIDGPPQRNNGIRVTLYNGSRAVIPGAQAATQTEEYNQTVKFCSSSNLFQVSFLAPPPDIKCQTKNTFPGVTAAATGGTQWLCEDNENAMKLIKGPYDKAKRYLQNGDQVCVDKDGKKTTYTCYEPYNIQKDTAYYEADTTKDDLLETRGDVCDTATSFAKDLTNSVNGIKQLNGTVTSGKESLTRSAQELETLYASMRCSTITTGGLKTMCDSIDATVKNIRTQAGTVGVLETNINTPLQGIESSRTLVNDIITKYSCS
jgi:hypothetical protein